jgi:hypothetical protein
MAYERLRPLGDPRLIALALFWLLLAAICGSCSPSPPQSRNRKSLTTYNASDKKVIIHQQTGIGFYDKGEGPSQAGAGVKWPDQVSALNTWGTVHVTYPVKVEWSFDGSEIVMTQNFDRIPNVSGDTIEEEGSLLLVFHDDEWIVEFFPGDPNLTRHQLRERYGRNAIEATTTNGPLTPPHAPDSQKATP